MIVLYQCSGKLSSDAFAPAVSKTIAARKDRGPEDSPESSVPAKEPVAEKQRNQGHAAQEDAEGHLIIAIDDFG